MQEKTREGKNMLQFLHTCKPNLGLIKFYITLRRIYSYHATHPPLPLFQEKQMVRV